MKCWTRYVLPLVIALCVFLGSSFCSLRVEAEEDVSYPPFFDLMTGWDNYFLIEDTYPVPGFSGSTIHYPFYKLFLYNGSTIGYIKGLNVYASNSFSSYSIYTYYPDQDTDWQNFSSGFNVSSVQVGDEDLGRGMNVISSSQDIYSSYGELVFQGPSPFQRVVRTQDWTAVMTEIVMILPLLIVFLVSLIGLRKGLRFISSLLHRA